MKENEIIIYNLLSDVFMHNAYSGIRLNERLAEVEDAWSRAYITKLFYGVIEKSIQFDYIIAELCEKKPKNSITVLLKMGLYYLRYTNLPDYAAINKTVDLAKKLGKGGMKGFVNAILRKSKEIDLNTLKFADLETKLSVMYSYPKWIVELLIKEQGREDAEAFLKAEKRETTHIRHNSKRISRQAFRAKLFSLENELNQSKLGEDANKSSVKVEKVEETELGYYVSHEIMSRLESGSFTAQSLASMIAVKAYTNSAEIDKYNIKRVLDLCSAPGGKAIYLKQLYNDLDITACDIHPHRLKLIKDYAKRIGEEIRIELNDATVYRSEWREKYDLVICDVPCSGLGVINSKPDIILNRKASDIQELAALQQKILETAAKYLKKDGILCYSTCTLTSAENQSIIQAFLSSHPDFTPLPITINNKEHDNRKENKEGESREGENKEGERGEGESREDNRWENNDGKIIWKNIKASSDDERKGGESVENKKEGRLEFPYLQLLPQKNKTDAFFIAKLIKNKL